MRITSLSQNKAIPFSDLINNIVRFDLIPIPLIVEFSVKYTEEYLKAFSEGMDILVSDIDSPLTIVKSQPIKTQTIKDGSQIGAISCVAVLKGCENLIKSTNKAVIQNSTSFNAIVRGCGCKLSLSGNIPVTKFVCLKGTIPTYPIAYALQKEACVMRFKDNKMNVVKIDDLFKQEPKLTFDSSAIAWTNSKIIEDIHKNSYVAVGSDGSTIVGSSSNKTGIGVVQKSGLTSRELKNLEKVLVTRGTIIRPIDLNLRAGDLVSVDGKKYIILTIANRFDTGSMGSSSATVSKIWIASL